MAGATKVANINITAREVDFVTRFGRNWQHLRDILGITRPIRKAPGTQLKSKYASVSLESGAVEEGATIPYSTASVSEKTYATISIEKYAKAVTLEAIDKYGYDNAVQRTDDEFLNELQQNVTDRFYAYLKTGTLTRGCTTFQMALAMAQGDVLNKWKAMHRSTTRVIGFCNILDAYAYLGAANITVQNQLGLNYIENFMGYSVLFLLSNAELGQGKVIATPAENVVLYYVDPADSDFARAGLEYRTDGDTNLIGFHVNGNYGTAVSESFAILGLTLFAEYLDGISVVTFGGSLGSITATSAAATTTNGATKLTITAPTTIPADWTLYAKSASGTAPSAGDYLSVLDTTGWTKITPVSGVADEVTGMTSGHKLTIAALNAAGQVVATGTIASVTVKG